MAEKEKTTHPSQRKTSSQVNNGGGNSPTHFKYIMRKRKVSIKNLLSTRSALGMALATTFDPTDDLWRSVVLVVAVGYLIVTALFGRKD